MTKIADLLAQGPTLSFEFSPPRTEQMERQLEKALAELAVLEPSFVSFTYGAMGTTRDTTRDIVIRANATLPFPAMAHLTCVGHTHADVEVLLAEYAAAGVDNILALGGDPPADGSDPGGEFAYATELIEVVRAAGDFSIAVGAHPEIHPRSPDRASDRRRLADKLAMADFAITQFFWSAEHYFRLVDELLALGCDTPVLPGVMPFHNVAGARRMSAMNGTDIPKSLQERLDGADGDPAAVIDLGIEVATELSIALLEGGVPGLHLYALNRSEPITRVYENLGLGPALT
jgi:methylenetetrahydrofolate reductase (NADPH)